MINELIAIENSEEVCQEIQKVACQGAVGEKCTRANAVDLAKVKPLTISLSDWVTTFNYAEYVYFDEAEVLACRFRDTKDIRSETNCLKNANILIGKRFMSKHVPMLTVSKDGISRISFLKELKVKKSLKWLFYLIGGVLILSLICIVICYINYKKKESDENYEAM